MQFIIYRHNLASCQSRAKEKLMNVEGADDLREAGDCGAVEVAPADPAKKNLDTERRWKGEGTEGKE